MKLLLSGQVVGVAPTPNGKYVRVFVQSGGRSNAVVMLPTTGAIPKVGDELNGCPVRVSVEKNREGQALPFVTFWLDEPRERPAKTAA